MSLYSQFEEFINDDETDNQKFIPRLAKLKWDCIEDCYRSIIRKKIKLDMDDGIFDTNFKICNQNMSNIHIENQRRISEKKEREKPLFMITINPNDTVDFNELWNEVVSLTRSVWFAEGYITWEQRGETAEEMGNGLHIHILMLTYNIKFCLLQKNLTRKFGPYVNLQKLRETLNISNKPRNELDIILDEYIFQNNKQEEKEKKIEIDKVWREKLGIKPYYYFKTEIGNKTGLTTDKKPVFKKADGRARNGGARKGSGAPKGNTNRRNGAKSKTEPAPQVSISNDIKILEF